jgi:hypothetical protein
MTDSVIDVISPYSRKQIAASNHISSSIADADKERIVIDQASGAPKFAACVVQINKKNEPCVSLLLLPLWQLWQSELLHSNLTKCHREAYLRLPPASWRVRL